MLCNRGQIGETLTWIVVTLIIILILSISIFVVSSSDFFKGERTFEVNKEADLLTTKSLTSFVMKNKDFVKNSVETNDYGVLEERFRPFLEDLQIIGDIHGWNLRVYVGDEEKAKIITHNILGSYCYYKTNLFFDSQIKLEFFGEYQC